MNKRTEIENEYEALLQARKEEEKLNKERLSVLEACHKEDPNLKNFRFTEDMPQVYRTASNTWYAASEKAGRIERKILELIGDAVFVTKRGECLVPGYESGDYGLSLLVMDMYN